MPFLTCGKKTLRGLGRLSYPGNQITFLSCLWIRPDSPEEYLIKQSQFIIHNAMPAVLHGHEPGAGYPLFLDAGQIIGYHYIFPSMDDPGWNMDTGKITAPVLIPE